MLAYVKLKRRFSLLFVNLTAIYTSRSKHVDHTLCSGWRPLTSMTLSRLSCSRWSRCLIAAKSTTVKTRDLSSAADDAWSRDLPLVWLRILYECCCRAESTKPSAPAMRSLSLKQVKVIQCGASNTTEQVQVVEAADQTTKKKRK